MKKIFDDTEIPNIEAEKIQNKQEDILQEDVKKNKNDNISEIFFKSREYWSLRMQDHSSNFKFIDKIVELQAELFSDRQILLEQKHKLYEKVSRLNSSINKQRKNKFIEYVTNYEIRLNGREKDIFVEADLSTNIEFIDLLNNQINFLEQTIKTIDNIIYGIKYRITIYDLIEK